MKIEKNVRIEMRLRVKGEHRELYDSVLDMMREGGLNVCARCEDAKEAKRVATAMHNMKKKRGWPVRVSKSMNDVYIIYEGNKK